MNAKMQIDVAIILSIWWKTEYICQYLFSNSAFKY